MNDKLQVMTGYLQLNTKQMSPPPPPPTHTHKMKVKMK